ncbi:MAG: hypothetical protein ABSG51_04700 [Terracidiphilus sp.]|jgi:hypothetical protein
MNKGRIAQFSVLASMLVLASSGQVPKFKVLVLDALDGKPQAGVKVEYFCEGKGRSPQDEVKTGSDGITEVPYKWGDGAENITVDVPGESKEECGGVGILRIGDILSRGVISEPTGAGGIWCPSKQRRKFGPVPGLVTVFVKKPTRWQSHVAG